MAVSDVTQPSVQQQVIELVTLLTARPITEEIALRVGDYDEFKHLEITNGEWVGLELVEGGEYMTGEEHGRIEFKLILMIGNFIMEHKLGMLYPGDTDFVLDGEPGAIRVKRKPDVAFVAAEHVQSQKGFYFRAPDLAVEIVSLSQRRPQMVGKASEYLTYGTAQVWLVFPERNEVEVHTADSTPQVYGAVDHVPGGDLLPDFEMDVAMLFEE